jgi:DNA-binding SARP family transcriptional activator
MEEEYAEWTEALRLHYATLRGRAMAELADLRYRSGDTDAAVELFEDLVRIDPVNEKASSGLMRAMAVRGDWAGIEKEWQRFGREYRREIGAAPAAEARRTYETALAAAKSRAKPS